jgi:hypothetical protein
LETSYRITFRYKDGRNVTLGAEDLQTAKDLVWKELENDPECCANIVIAEYESETPHKQSVKLESYRRVNGHIQLMDC